MVHKTRKSPKPKEPNSETSDYASSRLSKNYEKEEAKRRLKQAIGSPPRPKFILPQNISAHLNALPLMVELVVDTQVKKTREDLSDYYSHTGNSWNQSEIDEAYRLYESYMPLIKSEEDKSRS